MRRVLALLALAGCRPYKPQVVPVSIVYPIKVELPEPRTCDLESPPVAPEPPAWPSAPSEHWQRVYVHRRDYEGVLQHQRDMEHWARMVMVCLERLTGSQ